MKAMLKKYKHAWVLLYTIPYFISFFLLEKHMIHQYNVIHMPLDDIIPFVEIFVVPYLLWFPYIIGTVLYFFFVDVKEYYRLTAFLFIGMTIFLIVSAIYPNGHHLRPLVFPRDNIFTDMVRIVYQTDTPTNILPSIHVHNSIGACISIRRSEKLQRHRIIYHGTPVFTVLIILSTMFIKQHSGWDVLLAICMSWVLYHAIYHPGFAISRAKKLRVS